MRLIDTKTLRFRDIPDERSVKYAILSHRWEDEEVLFQDMNQEDDLRKARGMRGFYKIHACCRQAAKDDIRYAWIDTCCIDKSSSAELQETINSMFRWYRKAAVCYAYLSDVVPDQKRRYDIRPSQWFRRGWTLQELLAPHIVVFYSRRWDEIGTRRSLAREISSVTRISEDILHHGFNPNGTVLVAEIMSWAKGRKTTRVEDIAYSLLGLFNVYMPMLYGEGARAFIRLQEEILKQSEDQSIFAWKGVDIRNPGLLAPSPESFPDLRHHQSSRIMLSRRKSPSVTSEGILVNFRLIPFAPNIYLAILNYDLADQTSKSKILNHGIFLRALDQDNRFVRVRYSGQDLWSGHDSFHKSSVETLIGVTTTSGSTRNLIVVHRLSFTEHKMVEREPTCIYKVTEDPELLEDGSTDPEERRVESQKTGLHTEFKLSPGTYGYVGTFYLRAYKYSACVERILLGVDFDFSTICILSSSQDDKLRLGFFLSPDIKWQPVNDRTINELQEDASAQDASMWVYSVRNGPVWTTEGGSSFLVLKVSNKFGMGDDVVINIDARTRDGRDKHTSKGILSLKIRGCCPINFEILPFKSDIGRRRSRRETNTLYGFEQVGDTSEEDEWSRVGHVERRAHAP